MQQENKRIYQSHKLKTPEDAFAEIENSSYSKDRTYMMTMIKPNVEYLKQNGISEYQNFIEVMKKNGFKTDDMKNFILDFQYFINSFDDQQNIQKIDWIRPRELSKANFGEKNLLLNRLSYEYPNQMRYFAQQYVVLKYQNMKNPNAFLIEFHFAIQNLLNSSKKS